MGQVQADISTILVYGIEALTGIETGAISQKTLDYIALAFDPLWSTEYPPEKRRLAMVSMFVAGWRAALGGWTPHEPKAAAQKPAVAATQGYSA